jgi:sporulation protein YlmC with PRC-barrel domain
MSDTELDLGLGVLDHQLVDRDGRNCGNVDDLELTTLSGADGDAEVKAILVGGNAWRGRGVLGRLFAALSGDAVHVPWSEVNEVGAVVTLKRPAAELRLGRGDDRAARWVKRIPGS